MKPEIKYGIEIEGVFNLDEEYEVGDYHDGIEVNHWWKAETDSSIYRDCVFTYDKEIEYVSRVIPSDKFKAALDAFKSMFYGELKDNMYFNKSCGCHIHFSIPKTKFLKITPFENYAMLRSKFLKTLKHSNLRKELKEQVEEQYFRNYARKLEKFQWKNFSSGSPPIRQSEFNFCSEGYGLGLEWRSFNLNGVETWEEFYALFNMAKECIEDFVYNSIEYTKVNRFKLNNKLKNEEVVTLDVKPKHDFLTEKFKPQEIVVPVF